MAAGGGPCIPLASRILKDRSKPWQGTARARIPTCFMAESKFLNILLSAMKAVGISSGSKRPNIGPADYWSLTLHVGKQITNIGLGCITPHH